MVFMTKCWGKSQLAFTSMHQLLPRPLL